MKTSYICHFLLFCFGAFEMNLANFIYTLKMYKVCFGFVCYFTFFINHPKMKFVYTHHPSIVHIKLVCSYKVFFFIIMNAWIFQIWLEFSPKRYWIMYANKFSIQSRLYGRFSLTCTQSTCTHTVDKLEKFKFPFQEFLPKHFNIRMNLRGNCLINMTHHYFSLQNRIVVYHV